MILISSVNQTHKRKLFTTQLALWLKLWIVPESSPAKKLLTTTVSQFIKQIHKSDWTKVLEIEILDKSALLLLFILQSVLFNNQSMSTKKQISSLCKLYSVYEEIPEEFLDETDVDSYFFHNILDISQSHNRIVRDSKGSNKKSFAFKVFHFCDSKLQQRFNLKEEVSISKNEIESLLDSLGEFLKAFDQANKVSQTPLPKPKFEIGFTKAKDELFSHCYKDIVEHLNRQIRISFRFEKNKTCVFSIKKFEHYGDQFILTEVVNLGYREIKHLYKNRFFVAYKCKIFQSNYDV